VTATREEIPDLAEALRATGAPLVEVTGNDSPASRTCIPRTKLATKVAEVLADPIGYPPLSRTIVPGDQVAIATDESTPCLREVVAGVVGYLVANGVTIDLIKYRSNCVKFSPNSAMMAGAWSFTIPQTKNRSALSA